MRWCIAVLAVTQALAADTAASLAREIREMALDAEEAYRVRDLTLVKEDIRFYLTEGYLVFAKPVAGRRIGAGPKTDTRIPESDSACR
jgi:hypothetical protein